MLWQAAKASASEETAMLRPAIDHTFCITMFAPDCFVAWFDQSFGSLLLVNDNKTICCFN
jgi:hypothetical protein